MDRQKNCKKAANKMFYATTTKTLKKDLEKQLIIADCRSSSAIHKPQMKANDKVTLCQFHQQLKCNNSWFLLMSCKSPIFASENSTKASHRLPLHLINQIYKLTKDSNLMDGSVNLLIFE